MKFTVDHDLHIHSNLSICAKEEQTVDEILRYAQRYGLNTLCLTNHFWDEAAEGASDWYKAQNYAHVSSVKPLPQPDGLRFLFGCETELIQNHTLGILKETCQLFDFVIIPTTHFHMGEYILTPYDMENAEHRAEAWVRRLDHVLGLDLPFQKIGLAHLTSDKLAKPWEEHLRVLDAVPEAEARRLFEKAAKLGVGIELNSRDLRFSDEEAESALRLYRIAKDCGCKFYCGSDAHAIAQMDAAIPLFQRTVDLLGLTEDDKFIL